MDTSAQYDTIINQCRDLFLKKHQDYGTAWRVLRPSSLTDQIYIKAKRIRSIQESGINAVNEPIENEFIGIVNYCIMACAQLDLGNYCDQDMSADQALKLYNQYAHEAKTLMKAKNQDYGEAWRDMRVSSITDLILMKILRLKQIEDNDGLTLVSEGAKANYLDMLNYAVFALILLEF